MSKRIYYIFYLFIIYTSSLWPQDRTSTDRGRIINFYNHKHNLLSPLGYAHKLKNGRNDTEFVFQFSVKVPVIGDEEKTVLFAAYTQKSFWQVYNSKESRPFREHNYNPDIFIKSSGKKFNGDLGIEHESNGKSEPNSRAYNRTYLKLNYNTMFMKCSLKGWLTLSEEQGLYENYHLIGKGRSIDDYYGNAEFETTFFWGEVQFYNMTRYNPKTGYGFYRGNLSAPISNWAAPFLEYSNGYGDSLIDYNRPVERYMLGIIISR